MRGLREAPKKVCTEAGEGTEVLGLILLPSGRVVYARRDLKLHQTWVIEKYVTSTYLAMHP